MSFPHISKIESGDEAPSERLLRQLAKDLHGDLDEAVLVDELLLLARKLPDDLTDAVMEKAARAPEFLRSWQAGKITDSDVDRLLDEARKKP